MATLFPNLVSLSWKIKKILVLNFIPKILPQIPELKEIRYTKRHYLTINILFFGF